MLAVKPIVEHNKQQAAGPRAQSRLQGGGDRVGVLAGHHRAEVGEGEDETERGQHDRPGRPRAATG